MEPTLPTIEDLHDQLAQAAIGVVEIRNTPFFILQRVQTQALLHICQELEAINNNLEALRPNLPKGYSI